jgi:DNA-binding transcriptional LysR family regulator
VNTYSLLRQLRTDDLRYLLAVANLGRLGAAADHLGVDTSTVSRRLRALEKALGSSVLKRGADGWELTDFGRAIAAQARPIEAALEGVARAVEGDPEDVIRGNFRLTVPDGFSAVFAVPALANLRQHHPELNIEMVTATRQLNLHQSGFDLAIAVGVPVTKRLFTETLAEYRLSFYATEAYLQQHGRPAVIDDLRNHTLIFYVDSLLQVGDLDLSQYAPGIDAQFTTTNIFAQLEAAACGAGIGLIPKFMALRAPELVEITGIASRSRLQFTLAARRDVLSRPAFGAVRAALHREVTNRLDELL